MYNSIDQFKVEDEDPTFFHPKYWQVSKRKDISNSTVERIYITTENDRRVCHIFVKGCLKEDCTNIFGADGYMITRRNTAPCRLRLFCVIRCGIGNCTHTYAGVQLRAACARQMAILRSRSVSFCCISAGVLHFSKNGRRRSRWGRSVNVIMSTPAEWIG